MIRVHAVPSLELDYSLLVRPCYQPTIALSSKESNFVAASDAGKLTLYLRSVLRQLGIEPEEATPLFEDNAAATRNALHVVHVILIFVTLRLWIG